MAGTRTWEAALVEHEAVLAEALARIDGVPAERWLVPKAEGKWSPAEEALHLAMAYELGLAAASGGAAMKLRVSPLLARILRWTVLPFSVVTRSFPRGAAAPRELRPPLPTLRLLSAHTRHHARSLALLGTPGA